jgi:peptidoglycan/LPS O-acetylase OafA/YrhL
MSYEQTNNIQLYFSKRLRRILPAYVFVVAVSAFGLALLSNVPPNEYFSLSWVKYLVSNLLFLNFLQPTLPGVFENNPLPAVNGALWTLKIEMMFYLSLPVIVWFLRKVGNFRGIVFLYISSLVYVYVMGLMIQSQGGVYVELQRQLPGQLTYFLSGAALYYFYEKFVKNSVWLFCVAVLVYTAEYFYAIELLKPMALAVMVIYLGCVAKSVGNFGKYGDMSYGVYIYHCTVLQIFVALGMFGGSPLIVLSIIILIVLLLSLLSWHYIERPFLAKSSHYVITNS